MESTKTQLTPDEVMIVQMALAGTIEDLETTSKDPRLPLTPAARKDIRDMLKNALSAQHKLATASGKLVQLDPYQEGDEKEFITKES